MIWGILGLFLFVVICFKFLSYETKAEKEHETELMANLDDERIYDPITNRLISLEEAMSGMWEGEDHPIVAEERIQKFYDDEAQDTIRVLNYVKKSPLYSTFEVTDDLSRLLERLKMLSAPAQWGHHSTSYICPDIRGVVMFPNIYLNEIRGTYILFGLPIFAQRGHYYLREKTTTETLLDHLSNDDDLSLDGYECFTFSPSRDIRGLNKILERFTNEDGLEIEILEDQLFVKSVGEASVRELKRFEKIFDKASGA